MSQKTCLHCGQSLTRRDGEDSSCWRRRRYCDRSCASKASSRLPAEAASHPTPRAQARAKAELEHRAYIAAEVEHLLGSDHPDSIARRLGYANADNLTDALTRWGRVDLAARLHAGRVAA